MEKKIVQQIVRVKRPARFPNFVLEIPSIIGNKPFIYNLAEAAVSFNDTDDKFFLIYEFDKKVINNGKKTN